MTTAARYRQNRYLCVTILALVCRVVAARDRWTPGPALARDSEGETSRISGLDPVAWALLGAVDEVCGLDPRREPGRDLGKHRTPPALRARELLIEAAIRRGWEPTNPQAAVGAVWAAEREGGWEEACAVAFDAFTLAKAEAGIHEPSPYLEDLLVGDSPRLPRRGRGRGFIVLFILWVFVIGACVGAALGGTYDLRPSFWWGGAFFFALGLPFLAIIVREQIFNGSKKRDGKDSQGGS